mmetsp:Transcript_80807/g.168606  ORF Transcript_80807/g.168606 Transcript_80807/m.168606 type:complete len:249 (-) Transcript_80807:523-1269(-)
MGLLILLRGNFPQENASNVDLRRHEVSGVDCNLLGARADDANSPTTGCQTEVRGQIDVSEHLQNQVVPTWGSLLQLVYVVFLSVVHHNIDASILCGLLSFFCACRPNYEALRSYHLLCKLNRRETDGTRSAVDEHFLGGPDLASRLQGIIGGRARDADARALREGGFLRQMIDIGRLAYSLRCCSARDRVCCVYPVPNVESGDIGADGFNDTCPVLAGCIGQLWQDARHGGVGSLRTKSDVGVRGVNA